VDADKYLITYIKKNMKNLKIYKVLENNSKVINTYKKRTARNLTSFTFIKVFEMRNCGFYHDRNMKVVNIEADMTEIFFSFNHSFDKISCVFRKP
jgi:hypothetical protein